MLKVIVDLIRLNAHPWAAYSWATWKSWVLVLLIGIATGLDPATTALFYSPIWAVLLGVVLTLPIFSIGVAFIRWWLKRGGRWDGQGALFNLIVAASAIDLLGAGLTALGVPVLFTLPMFVFSLWIGANAIAGACQVSLRYALGGVVLSILPAMVAMSVLMMALLPIFLALGVALPPAAVAP